MNRYCFQATFREQGLCVFATKTSWRPEDFISNLEGLLEDPYDDKIELIEISQIPSQKDVEPIFKSVPEAYKYVLQAYLKLSK